MPEGFREWATSVVVVLIILLFLVLGIWINVRDDVGPPDVEAVFEDPIAWNEDLEGLSDVADDYMRELHEAVDGDVRFVFVTCPTEEDPDAPCPFPIAFSASTVLVLGATDDWGRLARGGFPSVEPLMVAGDAALFAVEIEGDLRSQRFERLNLSRGARVVPDHYFGSSPIHRGHPADDPEIVDVAVDIDIDGPDAPSGESDGDGEDQNDDQGEAGEGDNRRIGVIDVSDSSEPVGQHGPFIESIIAAMGHEPVLTIVPGSYSAADSSAVYIEEAAIVAQVRVLANDGGLDALSLSFGTFGSPDYGPDGLRQALDDDRLPSIVVASAGNDETDQQSYPAAFDDVVAVGSINENGDQSCFSNFGDWVTDWRVGEEVLGRGLFPWTPPGIESTDTGQAAQAEPAGDGPLRNQAATWSGTSFAAPIVAVEMAEDPSNPPTPTTTPTDIGPEADPTWGCGVVESSE